MIQKTDFSKKFEKIPVEIFESSNEAAQKVADGIIAIVKANSAAGKKTVMRRIGCDACIPVYSGSCKSTGTPFSAKCWGRRGQRGR